MLERVCRLSERQGGCIGIEACVIWQTTVCPEMAVMSETILGNLRFTIGTFELVLRSCLMSENNLQIRRHIGTMTLRPGTVMNADG